MNSKREEDFYTTVNINGKTVRFRNMTVADAVRMQEETNQAEAARIDEYRFMRAKDITHRARVLA